MAEKEKKSKVAMWAIRCAERVTGESFTRQERKLMASDLGKIRERREKRLGVEMANSLHPACTFRTLFTPEAARIEASGFVPSDGKVPNLPDEDVDIAYSPVSHLSAWIKEGSLTCIRLTQIYLERMKRYGETLECLVTLTEDQAINCATERDNELKRGIYRGPLHGIPWGAKDLLDTAGVATTWGAAPFRERVPATDARVVKMLHDAGAVLVGKLTLGALANGDVWFGGITKNPWNLEQGSSGSSAGSAAATAAGLVGFAIGSETLGSIVSPSMRCGTVGLRPSFGRVSRTGAMALCWSLDKLGPICRSADDAALVLQTINGYDKNDPGSVAVDFGYGDPMPGWEQLTVGYDPSWFEDGDENGKAAIEGLRSLGCKCEEIQLPSWPYDSLMAIVDIEAAAAFEELTLSNNDDQLTRQSEDAWPNLFRKARLIPAVELVQADRFRRKIMEMMEEKLRDVDFMVSPGYAGPMLTITNFTGQPSLTVTTGFTRADDGKCETPTGLNLWGRGYDEALLCRIGQRLEEVLGVKGRRPPQFS